MPKPKRKMKLLVRSKAICHDDPSENHDPVFPTESPLSSSSCFISDSIFPSPYPISREEAIKEAVGLLSVNQEEQSSSLNVDSDENHFCEGIAINETEERLRSQNGSFDGDSGLGSSKQAINTPRRETEKPPRMQKQRSQDLLLQKQQKSFDSETKKESFSRDSSVECVDSTGVDVHEFLINTLQSSQRDRVILLKLEHDMTSFVNDKTIDFMKFPPMTSYHRMLVHRVAAYFGMDHNVDETGKSVIINKTRNTRVPESRFTDHFDTRSMDHLASRREEDMRRRSILKRTNQQSRSFDSRDDLKGRNMWKDIRQRSIEEREEEYEKIRARIFSQEGGMNQSMYGRRNMSSMSTVRMSSWAERPWNSSDMEPLPSVRMPMTRPLTTRASSYSSILPRHNSATSVKTGSSSSMSSMGGANTGAQAYPQTHPTHSLGNVRPVTPVRRVDSSNEALYYMQPQSQEQSFDPISIEDDIPGSWFEMADSPEPQNVYEEAPIIPDDTPILLAVPLGVTLPPETVLCHPLTGMPYLSPEGYQLVYQPSPTVPDGQGMTSPHVAQYYQMPPQPSPQHPSMGYPQGQSYSPYDSPQKASTSMGQVPSNNTDYMGLMGQTPSNFLAISNYQQNISMSSSSGQVASNMGLSQQTVPTSVVYKPVQKPMVGTQSNDGGSLQNGVPMMQSPMIYNPGVQGKQSPAYYGSQSMPPMVQHPGGANPTYPPYVYTPSNPAVSHAQMGVTPIANTVTKDGSGTKQVPSTPRTVLSHPPPGVPAPQYQAYPNQPLQVICSPPPPQLMTGSAAPPYSQKTPSGALKPSKGSHPSPSVDDELSEKMQAIVLKNMQQQQGAPHEKSVDPTNTVTTSVGATANPRQPHQSVADPTKISTVPIAPHVSEQQGMSPQGYLHTGNVHQPQPMQVYFVPANNPIPGGPSYRTYSQFLTQPQTPHVMGPGMQFVYLSPQYGGVVGVDRHQAPPNPQIIHNHQYVQQGAMSQPTHAGSNNNNNNAQLITDTAPTSSEVTPPSKEGGDWVMGCHSEETQPTNAKGSGAENEADKTTDPAKKSTDKRSRDHTGPGPAPLTNVTFSTTAPTAVTGTTKNHRSGSAVDQHGVVPGTHVMGNHNQQLLLGSHIHPDYRMSGMNITPSASFASSGMVPQYPMYTGVAPAHSPYVKYYLPATAPHAQKAPEMKNPTGMSSPVSLIAVQLPNQSQYLVPASIAPSGPMYYTTHNPVATIKDYTNPQAVNPPYTQEITIPVTSGSIEKEAPEASGSFPVEVQLPNDTDFPDTHNPESGPAETSADSQNMEEKE